MIIGCQSLKIKCNTLLSKMFIVAFYTVSHAIFLIAWSRVVHHSEFKFLFLSSVWIEYKNRRYAALDFEFRLMDDRYTDRLHTVQCTSIAKVADVSAEALYLKPHVFRQTNRNTITAAQSSERVLGLCLPQINMKN